MFPRRTMSPNPRVCVFDMSHDRVGPPTNASRSEFETDATAISILEPPEPRVDNHHSTFVDPITLIWSLLNILLTCCAQMELSWRLHTQYFLFGTYDDGGRGSCVLLACASACSTYSSFPWIPDRKPAIPKPDPLGLRLIMVPAL